MEILFAILICFLFIMSSIFILSPIIIPLTFGKWRMNYYSNGNRIDGWHRAGWQECPWKWLAIYRLKKKISNKSNKIGYAYVEDISEKYFNRETCNGKIVWEWEEQKDGKKNERWLKDYNRWNDENCIRKMVK